MRIGEGCRQRLSIPDEQDGTNTAGSTLGVTTGSSLGTAGTEPAAKMPDGTTDNPPGTIQSS